MTISRIILIALLVCAPVAAQARTQASLGDLNIPASRVPDWYAAPDGGVPDTSGWTVLDATQYGANPADNGGDDRGGIQSAINAAGPRTVIWLPAGTYYISSSANGSSLEIKKSDIVIRGAGPGQTVIRKSGEGRNMPGSGACQQRAVFHVWGSGQGTNASWTSGFTKGTSQLGVSSTAPFRAGEFVQLYQSNVGGLLDNPDGSHDVFAPLAKVSSVGANQITLDRPLRHDFTSSNRRVYQLNYVERVGIENLSIRLVDQSSNTAGACLRHVVNSWIDNVEIADAWEQHLVLWATARVLVQNSTIRGVRDNNTSSNYGIWLRINATDNLIYSNVFDGTHNGTVIQQGANGNVVAYNYFVNSTRVNRPIFLHGTYPYENLSEGNDLDGRIELDDYWGRQGPRNTFFRNRNRVSSGTTAGMMSLESFYNNFPIADATVLLLNSFWGYAKRIGCGEYETGRCFAFDETGHSNVWLELNAWRDQRSVNQCTGPGVPYPCCNGNGAGACNFGWKLKPRGDTSCGASPSGGGCSGDTNQLSDGLNFETLKPVSAMTSRSLPRSLVQGWDSATPPPGWCEEVPWPAIGANLDDFTTGTTMLPAQRRHMGLACTGSSTPRPQVPSPPILLD